MATHAEQQFHQDFNQNVKALESARKNLNQRINHCLRKSDFDSLRIYTKLYALLYCAWAEANLVKIVHTPFGFSEDEKKHILQPRDVVEKWIRCMNTAFAKFKQRTNSSEIPNKKRKINKLIKQYIETPRELRNKIAHGQWEFPLESNNIKPATDVKISLDTIDIIQIDIWFDVSKSLSNIVLGLVDARNTTNNQGYKAHYHFYEEHLSNIETILKERQKWTIHSKIDRLQQKPIPTGINSDGMLAVQKKKK
ncbi:MAG: hypothetical protein J0L99_03305 [Chitinophagales bacterium]|nr:hypothetical protein [Chitinophagales bacterium]